MFSAAELCPDPLGSVIAPQTLSPVKGKRAGREGRWTRKGSENKGNKVGIYTFVN